MRQRSELGEWFYETLGFRLSDLGWLAVPVFLASLAVPPLAWHLRRRRVIAAGLQRLVEVVWVAATTLAATTAWAIWAIDYCDRITSDRFTPFAYGFLS
jgi:hypothetical protein